MTDVNFKKGEIPRGELELPRLYFVAMDNWIDVIGERALMAWLRFYTWCDRSDKNSEVNKWEESKIPNSFNDIMKKKLGVGKDTFYNKILKPLWNVGLIDIEEWEEDTRSPNKALNIIVYKYPQNDISLASKPLEFVRDYDKDYSSAARTFAKKGGRPKSEHTEGSDVVPKENHPGSEIEPPLVPKENHPGSEIGHNNILNYSFNSFNNLNNILNNLINISNSSSSSKGTEKSEKTPYTFEDEDDVNTRNIFYSRLFDFLVNKGLPQGVAINTVKKVIERGITQFTMKDLEDAYKKMEKHNALESINHPHIFYTNGLETAIASNAIDQSYQKRVQKELDESAKRPKVPFYNWLEDDINAS